MRSLSMLCLSLEFVWGQGFHRQRVDFLAHAVAQRGVDQLVALDQTLADEGRRNDDGLEVLAVALHFEVGAFEAGGQVAVDQFWGGGHDGSLVLNGDKRYKRYKQEGSMTQAVSAAQQSDGDQREHDQEGADDR